MLSCLWTVFGGALIAAAEDVMRFEAEDADIDDAVWYSDHVGQIDNPGSALTFEDIIIPEDGNYTMRVFHCAPMGAGTHTLFVDDVQVATINYPGTGGGWGSFSESIYAELQLTLTKGNHTFCIEKTEDDNGFIELDAFELFKAAGGGEPEQPVETEQPGSDGIRIEAESAEVTGTVTMYFDHIGGIDNPGTVLTFNDINIPDAGKYTMRIYYCAPMGDGTHTVSVDNATIGTVNYPGAGGGWGSFSKEVFADVELTLTKGLHTICIERTDDDTGFVELDAFELILVEKAEEPEQPVEIEQPGETQQPVETEQPGETQQPVETEQPGEVEPPVTGDVHPILAVVLLLAAGTVILLIRKKSNA